jgi:uncharacterized protein (TIGR02001 family)
MRISMMIFSGFALAATVAATPAFAQEETAPPKAITINGTAAITSDYRFRGISQSNTNGAVQGSLTIAHKSGFYATVWASTVNGYVTAAADPAGTSRGQASVEMDLSAGFKHSFGGTTLDGGVLYYYYPKDKQPGDRTSSDFFEPYASISQVYGPVTGKVTVNYAPKQKALSLDQIGPSKSNVYLAGDVSFAIPKTPVSLSGHIGHTFGPSWLAIGNEYNDWNIGASYTWQQFTASIQYVDTDGVFITPSGKDAAKSGAVASLTFAF